MKRSRLRKPAFTLIELVASLAIAVMLAAALHGALSTVWKAKKTAEAAIEPTRMGTIALDIICRDLAAAPPLPASDSTTAHLGGPFTGVHQPSGSSDNDDLSFHTLVRDEGAPDDDPLADGMKIIEYLVQPDGASPTLVRRVTRDILAAQTPVPVDENLCRNVRGLSLRYYDGTQWQTDWDSTALGDVLPIAVQVTLQINDPTAPPAANGTTPAGVREVSRVVPLACAKPASTSTTP
jgi:type II secretion system protein J